MRKFIINKFPIIILLLITIKLNSTFGDSTINDDDDNGIITIVSPITTTSHDFITNDYFIEYLTTIKYNENSQQQPVSIPQNDEHSNVPSSTSGSSGIVCGSTENLYIGQFTIFDYCVVIGMLVISLGIGVFYGFFNKSAESNSSADFLHGSEMTTFPVSLSLTTSFITAIELLGNPSEMFYQGTQFSLIVISMLLVIPVAIKIFYPIYFKLQLTSCYEYLGIRFGKEIRIFGAILYILQMTFYTAVSVYAPAIALSKATGLNTRIAVALIYIVCIFYASQGGMKAVVIADTFQASVLAVSLIVIVILGSLYTGNLTDIFTVADTDNRLEFLNHDPNPTTRHTIFSVVIGGFFYWTSLLCTNQATVQKCMSLKSPSKANLALILSTIGLVTVFIINFYTGLLLYKHYRNCDPLKSGLILGKDELLPYYVMDVFQNLYFVNGLFVAGIFAASLGTVAAALNSLSAVTTEDILITALNIKIDPSKGACYGKWMSLGYGLISFALVFVVEQLGGILQATLTLNGLIGGVTLGLFSLGIFFTSANKKGAFFGGATSLLLIIIIGIMAQIYNDEPIPLSTSLETCNCFDNKTYSMNDNEQLQNEINGKSVSPLFRISYMWYSFLGCILTILFGLLISLITEKISDNNILIITKGNDNFKNKNVNGINEKSSTSNGSNAGSNETIKMETRSSVISIIENLRKKSFQNSPQQQQQQQQQEQQYQLHGVDNVALKIDEF